MSIEKPIDEDLKALLKGSYTDLHCKAFVQSIMSDNISPDDICRSLVGLGVSLNLSRRAMQTSVMNEQGELESIETSEFQMFLDVSIDKILFDKDLKDWARFYKNTLIIMERYELLHTLKLEKTWNV